MSQLRRNLRVRLLQFTVLAACVITPLAAVAQPQSTVAVPAADEWTDTGIELLPGDALGVRAAGEWSNVTGGRFVGQNGYGTVYPGTRLVDAPLAALIARIGDSLLRPTVELSEVRFRGRLTLGMNDVPGTFNDNQGTLHALVRYVQRPAPVPDFSGSTEADAAKFLSQYQFVPIINSGASALASGLVYDQVPKAGDLHGVAEVSLYVSTGPAPEPPSQVPPLAQVPDVIGLPRAAAERAFRDSGLRGRFRALEDSMFSPGVVVRTAPPASASIQPQSIVDYWLATGRALVPDVRGQPLQRAYQILNQAGFRSTSSDSQVIIGQAGRVIRQAPLQNTSAPIGTVIALTAGRGVPWWWLAGLTGTIALVTTAAWLASRRRPPKPSSRPTLGHFEAALEADVVTPPRTLGLHGPPMHLEVELEDGTVRTPALVILEREKRSD